MSADKCGHCGAPLAATRQRLRWTKVDGSTVDMCPDCFTRLVLTRAAEARAPEQKN